MLHFGCLLNFIVWLAYALLLLRFVLLIFYPGTPETMGLFQTLHPFLSTIEGITTTLMFPVTYLSHLLTPFLPGPFHAWFPHANAAEAMQAFAKLMLNIPGLKTSPIGQNLLKVDYAQHYPGHLDWLALLAIVFWSSFLGVLQGLGGLLNTLVTAQREPAPRPRTQTHSWEPGTSYTHLPQTEERRRPDPDLGVREMLNSLKQENTSLQVQKHELRATFSQYVSPNVLKYIEQNRNALQQVANQTQRVSILFCDIRGFTAFSQSHTPDEVARFLSDYFSVANDIIINQYDGTINKLMGDGIMAYWGFPIPTPDHAFIATQAALAIVKALAQWNQDATKTQIHVGIGICTGEVMVGNIGSKDFMDFTLIGEPVNLASRLEGVNKRFNTQILIDESTFQGVRGRVRCQDQGLVDIRGWEGQLHVYEPLS